MSRSSPKPRSRLWMMLILAPLLASCATVGPATDACAVFEPIYVSRLDVLTDQTAREILAHNELGAKLCGW